MLCVKARIYIGKNTQKNQMRTKNENFNTVKKSLINQLLLHTPMMLIIGHYNKLNRKLWVHRIYASMNKAKLLFKNRSET